MILLLLIAVSQTTTPRPPESSLRRQWRDCIVQQTDPRNVSRAACPKSLWESQAGNLNKFSPARKERFWDSRNLKKRCGDTFGVRHWVTEHSRYSDSR
ncbi:MAG: hypothetical protein LBT05_09715 [Planctomycetaceae bacterium]|nr:hypothetical protein [Planctomycetaceae bacterium]